MGTSQSSRGPGGGVPLVPPWASDPPVPGDEQDGGPEAPDEGDPLIDPPTAPPGRFRGARVSMGRFALTGDRVQMARGLGHYVRTGYGGSGTAVRRFGGTARTANALHGALSTLAAGGLAPRDPGLDPDLLAGESAAEVIDAVVEAVRPIDGTQDTEASREAISAALAELLVLHPEADLLFLSDEQRAEAVELFVGLDVYRRFELDVGKTIQDKAPSAAVALSRLRQVKDYVREAVGAAFRRLRVAGDTLTAGHVSGLVQRALRHVLSVFEVYAE